MRRFAAIAVSFALCLTGASALTEVAAAASPDVVISQVYGGGGNSGATYTNDYVQLYNRSEARVDLTGWSVQYASASGTHWQVTPLAGTVAPGGRYLVAEARGAGGTTPLPDPDASGSIHMSASRGKVALVTSADALGCGSSCATAPAVRDFVGYGSADDYEGSGPAPGLSNTTADLRGDGGAKDTDDNAADFHVGAPDPAGSGEGTGCQPSGATPGPVRIHAIQGRSHRSPYDGRDVAGVPGVVTATEGDGFYLQDPHPDSDPATSEGIFVFGTHFHPSVGEAVTVDGRVHEFRPGGSGSDNLTITEIEFPTVHTISCENPLPPASLIGADGRVPPGKVIEDDATCGDVEQCGVFDPASDGLDFDESLEGMRVEVGDAVAVGPTNRFEETPIVSASAASVRSARGGIVVRVDDFNPERYILGDDLAATPTVDTGARATTPVAGIMSYAFGNYTIEVTRTPAFAPADLPREVTAPARPGELSVGTFNVENLAATSPPDKFERLARIVVHNLRSPDILAVEEIQDNNGPTDNGVVDASQTWQRLIDAIAASGGPTYSYTQIDPADDMDGGQPGGNIRVGFLYDHREGLRLVRAPHGDTTTPESVVVRGGRPHLALNPGRIDPANPAWQDSRKPLAAEFRWRGQTLFVVANHFASKGGDDALEGRHQPPVQVTEPQRVDQARAVHDFVARVLDVDAAAKVAVVGDLNDFGFSRSVRTLAGDRLLDLPATLPVPERYTYVFEGNSQVLDHILLSPGLARVPHPYDVVHVNSEYADAASDHEPQLVRLRLKPAG